MALTTITLTPEEVGQIVTDHLNDRFNLGSGTTTLQWSDTHGVTAVFKERVVKETGTNPFMKPEQ